VGANAIAVKKYVVTLSAAERVRLDEMIHKGQRAAQLLTKARILLKADVSDAGEGWSDRRIAEALDTSIATVERTRRQLIEEGFDAGGAVHRPGSALGQFFLGLSLSAGMRTLISAFLGSTNIASANIAP